MTPILPSSIFIKQIRAAINRGKGLRRLIRDDFPHSHVAVALSSLMSNIKWKSGIGLLHDILNTVCHDCVDRFIQTLASITVLP